MCFKSDFRWRHTFYVRLTATCLVVTASLIQISGTKAETIDLTEMASQGARNGASVNSTSGESDYLRNILAGTPNKADPGCQPIKAKPKFTPIVRANLTNMLLKKRAFSGRKAKKRDLGCDYAPGRKAAVLGENVISDPQMTTVLADAIDPNAVDPMALSPGAMDPGALDFGSDLSINAFSGLDALAAEMGIAAGIFAALAAENRGHSGNFEIDAEKILSDSSISDPSKIDPKPIIGGVPETPSSIMLLMGAVALACAATRRKASRAWRESRTIA